MIGINLTMAVSLDEEDAIPFLIQDTLAMVEIPEDQAEITSRTLGETVFVTVTATAKTIGER